MKDALTQNFHLAVDGKEMEYPGTSIWNFPLDQLIISTDTANVEIAFQLTKERYEVEMIRVVENSYSPLKPRIEQLAETSLRDVTYTRNKLQANVVVDYARHYVIVLPFSKGWTLKVNGNDIPLYNVNNMLIGFEIGAGEHTVELTYVTPYLKSSLIASYFTLYPHQASFIAQAYIKMNATV